MKTLLHTLFFFLLATQICFGQWYPQNSGTTQHLNKVQFVDANTGWAVGDSGLILKTSDGGSSWIHLISGTTENLNDIQFVNADIGWIVGGTRYGIYPSYSFTAVILKTINGGSNWFQQMADTTYCLNAVSFIDDNTGWAVGGRNLGIFGTILKTTNGGNNWISQGCQMTYELNSVHFVEANTGWAVGIGTLHKTTDGGINWTYIQTGSFFDVWSVYFIDSDTGWTVENNYAPRPDAIVSKTTDGGTVWSSQNLGLGSGELIAIHFSDGSTGWVVGLHGRIYKTTNGGTNWIEQTSGTFSTLSSVYFIDSNTGWAAGKNGTVLYTTNGGVTFIDNEPNQPKDFLLSQNFPNPFNPSTTLSWQSPVGSHQTIKVYDVLGNEVATLVDEYKPAGSYEVEFNAERLSSGVYFYQLRVEDFIQTRKMILLK